MQFGVVPLHIHIVSSLLGASLLLDVPLPRGVLARAVPVHASAAPVVALLYVALLVAAQVVLVRAVPPLAA